MSWWGALKVGGAILGGVGSFISSQNAKDANRAQAESRQQWAEWNYEQDARKTVYNADRAATMADTRRAQGDLERRKSDITSATADLTRDRANLFTEGAAFADVRAAEALRVGELGRTLENLKASRIRRESQQQLQALGGREAGLLEMRQAQTERLNAQMADRVAQYNEKIAEVEIGAAAGGVGGGSVIAVRRAMERARDRDLAVMEADFDATVAASDADFAELRAKRGALVLSSAFAERYAQIKGTDSVRRGEVAARGIVMEGDRLRVQSAGTLLQAGGLDIKADAEQLGGHVHDIEALFADRSALEAIEGLNTRPAVPDYVGIAKMGDSAWGNVGTFLSGASSAAGLAMNLQNIWDEWTS